MMGLVFSAFSWTYAASQIPGGIFLDRFGSRLTYAFSLIIWSLFTFFIGTVSNLWTLISLRLGLGVAEAPCFPANTRVVSAWFPQRERARATGIYSVGEYVGLAFLSPVLFWVTESFGWRSLFFLLGAVGVLFGIAWWLLYRDPHNSRRVNRAELDYIASGANQGAVEPVGFSWQLLRRLVGSRRIVGASVGQFAGNCTLVFFVTWFPTYLSVERHMSFMKAGFYASLPFIAGAVGVTIAGLVSDQILHRTGSPNMARKAPMIVGFLFIGSISLDNYVTSDKIAIAIMAAAFFGQGLVGTGWTVITDIAPRRAGGLAAGVFNFATNLAGIVTPFVIGMIVKTTGSFAGALLFVAAMAVLGVCSYLFIIDDIAEVDIG
jgi:ACS family D-galactonate transporter-like MFS transporter